MQLYKTSDLELAKERLGPIIKNLEKEKLKQFEPTAKEIMSINDIVLKYVKNNKRKIYGGYAQNILIKNRNKDDAFYEEGNIRDIDIDFYSPDPIGDLRKLANELYDKGYKFVEGKQAMHGETYSLFVNSENVADISYVPRNIYHRMAFEEIDGTTYAAPSFIMIDLYRMFTEPYWSSFRWEKTFPRAVVLQKHYPFNKNITKLSSFMKQDKTDDKMNFLLDSAYKFIKNKKSIIVTGDYAYNAFLHKSEIMKDDKLGDKYAYISNTPFQFISTDYKTDTTDFLNTLKQENKTLASQISIVEHYPFWQMYGYNTFVYFGDRIIAHIIYHNKRCTPYKTVDAYRFYENKAVKDDGKINIGSYNFTFLMNLCNGFKYKVHKDNAMYQYHNMVTSHLIQMRNYYLEKNKKNIFDDTLFQEFVTECVGETLDPIRETVLVRRSRYIEKKFPIIYKYNPETDKNSKSVFRFPNTSGNPIQKDANFKIVGQDIPRKDRSSDKDNDEDKIEEIDDSVSLDVKDIEKSAMKRIV
jgi:hypothetical protein